MVKEDRFAKALYYSKSIIKEDILRIAEEVDLKLTNKRIAKDKLIQEFINQNKFENLYINFKEFLYIPCWQIADAFNLNTEEIEKLSKLGVIKETPKQEQYWDKHSKSYYHADTYPLDVLDNYTEEELKLAYKTAYSDKGFNVRIETETKEEADSIISQMDKIFEISRTPKHYDRRSHGINTYFTIKKPNNTELEKARYRLEIDKKNKEIEKLKNEHKADLDRLVKKVGSFMGIFDASIQDVREKCFTIKSMQNTINKLKEELEQYKSSTNI